MSKLRAQAGPSDPPGGPAGLQGGTPLATSLPLDRSGSRGGTLRVAMTTCRPCRLCRLYRRRQPQRLPHGARYATALEPAGFDNGSAALTTDHRHGWSGAACRTRVANISAARGKDPVQLISPDGAGRGRSVG